jgi:hypothetical protein
LPLTIALLPLLRTITTEIQLRNLNPLKVYRDLYPMPQPSLPAAFCTAPLRPYEGVPSPQAIIIPLGLATQNCGAVGPTVPKTNHKTMRTMMMMLIKMKKKKTKKARKR